MVTGMENHKASISSNLFVHFVAGGLAGITAASATYPLDLVRTRLAAQVGVFEHKYLISTLLHNLVYLFYLLRFHNCCISWLLTLFFASMADKSNLLHGYLAYSANYY